MSRDPRPRRQQPRSPREQAKTESPAKKKVILRQIARSRTRLLVCFMTLPVYVVGVWMLLNNQREIGTFMYLYMGVWAVFGVDMARRRCPNCGEQFFVKVVLLNLFTRRCVHCGLPMDQGDGGGGSESDDSMEF